MSSSTFFSAPEASLRIMLVAESLILMMVYILEVDLLLGLNMIWLCRHDGGSCDGQSKIGVSC